MLSVVFSHPTWEPAQKIAFMLQCLIGECEFGSPMLQKHH